MMFWIRYDYGTASVLEIVWTLIGVIGFWYTARCLNECRTDLWALARVRDFRQRGPRHIIAKANLRQYTFRLVTFIFILIIGVFAMVTPRNSITQPPTLYSIVLGIGFILTESMMSLGSFLDTKDRRLVMRQIEEERTNDARARQQGGRRQGDSGKLKAEEGERP